MTRWTSSWRGTAASILSRNFAELGGTVPSVAFADDPPSRKVEGGEHLCSSAISGTATRI